MLAFDYYIIKESKNKFKDWTKAGLEFLKQHLNNIKDKNEKRRVKRILEKLNRKKRWM